MATALLAMETMGAWCPCAPWLYRLETGQLPGQQLQPRWERKGLGGEGMAVQRSICTLRTSSLLTVSWVHAQPVVRYVGFGLYLSLRQRQTQNGLQSKDSQAWPLPILRPGVSSSTCQALVAPSGKLVLIKFDFTTLRGTGS